jgi:ribosomal protein S18 acetylase RimI-like enzyme
MSDEVRARPATPADASFIAGLVPSFVEVGLPAGRDPDEVAAEMTRTLTAALDSGAAVFVAESGDGTPLGFVHLHSTPDLTGRPRAHVSDLAVAGHAQGRGVGRTLLELADRWAADQGYDHISLTALTTNHRALAVYERLGFVRDTITLIKPVG